MRSYRSDTVILSEIGKYTLDDGYSVGVIKPSEMVRTSYTDEARGNVLDVTYTAVTPPAMRPSCRHLD